MRFDQSRMGLETTKPTRLVTRGLDLSALNNLRCKHPKGEQVREDGSKYKRG